MTEIHRRHNCWYKYNQLGEIDLLPSKLQQSVRCITRSRVEWLLVFFYRTVRASDGFQTLTCSRTAWSVHCNRSCWDPFRAFEPVGLGWGLRIFICYEFPGDAVGAMLGSYFEKLFLSLYCNHFQNIIQYTYYIMQPHPPVYKIALKCLYFFLLYFSIFSF